MAQEFLPVDFPITRRPMIIVAAAVVMSVNHSEMTGKFVDEIVHVASQKSVTGVKADAYFCGVDTVQDPQDVTRVPEKEVGQFIFQHAHDAEFFTAPRDLIQ